MDTAAYGNLLDSLRGVTWPSRRVALAGMAGSHLSKLRGMSAEFTEYRPYRQGDDPRRIDWKLLARSDRFFVRLTSDRAALGTVVVVDASASMGFPESGLGKWSQACLVALGLAAVAHASGDPVGLVLAGAGTARAVRMRSRRGVLGEMARVLASIQPSGEAALARLLPALARTPRVALVSDLLDDEEATRGEARRLEVSGTEVHVVHIVAREEAEGLPGGFLAVDPERPQVRRTFSEAGRTAYVESFASWRLSTARAWRASGAAYTEVMSDEPAHRAVRRVCSQRRSPHR